MTLFTLKANIGELNLADFTVKSCEMIYHSDDLILGLVCSVIEELLMCGPLSC